MRVYAIILAAGESTRLGRPKQLVRLGGELLLERAVRIVREAGWDPIVVLGASSEVICDACNLQGCHILLNADWARGLSSSLRAGVSAARELGAEGVIVMTCDQPAVSSDHLRLLAAASPSQPIASAYAGRHGIPAYLPAQVFDELMQLSGDTGAKELLRHAAALDFPGGELDIDTEESLLLAEQWLAQSLRMSDSGKVQTE